MDTLTTTHFAKWIGKSINRALQNPVGLTIRDEIVAVVISKFEWDRLKEADLEDETKTISRHEWEHLKRMKEKWVDPDWHRKDAIPALEKVADGADRRLAGIPALEQRAVRERTSWKGRDHHGKPIRSASTKEESSWEAELYRKAELRRKLREVAENENATKEES